MVFAQQKGVDLDIVRSVFPYGKIETPKIVRGGLRWHSGIIIPELGDPPPEKEIGAETSDEEDAPVTCNDESFAAVAAVRVGY
ncbi:g9680 [Coccomyxa elongata]